MKLLITGAAGFIGYHLTRRLLEDGFDILGIDNLNDYYDTNLKKNRLKQLRSYGNFTFLKVDISQKNALKNCFKKFDPQKVVNLAAQAGVRYSLTNPDEYMRSNLVGFLNVIELCKDCKVEGLVYASSSSVYGANEKIPFDINDKTSSPVSLYGATKMSNELIAHAYSKLYDLPTTGLRFFTVYGSWYRPDMGIFKFVKNILKNEKIKIFNNGNMKRDFTYIDDIIEGTISAINKNYSLEIFNLGNNQSENLMDLIQFIETNLERKALIDFQPLQLGDMVETYADISKSVELLDYNPTTNLKEGVPKFISWYREYYNV